MDPQDGINLGLPTTPGEGTTPPQAEPPAGEGMITLPDAGDHEQEFEVKVRGETLKVPLRELLDGYSRQEDYTRSKQELAEEKRGLEKAREMREFIESYPDAAPAIAYLMQQGGLPEQGIQPGPAAPEVGTEPAVGFLMDQVSRLEYQMEAQQFKSQFPDADVEAVAKYAYDNHLPSLETAHKVMTYEDQGRLAARNLQTNIEGRQAAAVEPGSEGPPGQIRVRPKDLSDEQIADIAMKHYGLVD